MKKFNIKNLPKLMAGEFVMVSTPVIKEIVELLNSQSEAIESLQNQIVELQQQLQAQRDNNMMLFDKHHSQIKTVATSLKGVITDE